MTGSYSYTSNHFLALILHGNQRRPVPGYTRHLFKITNMKKFSFIAACLCLAVASKAQLKSKTTCPAFEVDILDGKVNGYKANVIAGMVKNKWPCYTSIASDTSKCGEGVFYKDKGISFYSARNYIEITEGFKGKLSLPLIGAARGSLFKTLGNPKMKDDAWDAYQTSYGTLILYYNKLNKVRMIQISTENTATIRLCE